MVTADAARKELARRELARREVARAERREAIRTKDAEDYNPTAGMGTIEKLAVGNTAGWADAGRKAVNLVLPDAITPEWASDKAIDEQSRLDAPLERTGAGLTGKIVGSLAATAPAAGAASGGVKAIAAGSKLARAAPVLSRALGAAPTAAAVEGGVAGAMLSKPGERVKGALTSAALGGGISGAAGLVGKAGRGLKNAMKIDITDEARDLQKIMAKYGENAGDDFIPLSQSAKAGVGKQIYEGLIANTPSAGQKLRGQYQRALHSFRETAMGRSLPHGVNINQVYRPAQGDDIWTGFRNMSSAWDDAFQPVRNMDIGVTRAHLPKKEIVDLVESLGDYKFPVPKGGTVKGQDILDMKEAIQKTINFKAPGDKGVLSKGLRDELIKSRNNLETAVLRQLRLSQRTGAVAKGSARARQFDLANYKNWRKLRAAAESAGGDAMFTPPALLRAASKGREKVTLKGGKELVLGGIEGQGGRLQNLGRLGKEALAPFPSKQGIFQTVAALGVMGAGGGIGAATSDNPILGGLVGFVSPILLARGLANPTVQKALSGQLAPSATRAALVRGFTSAGMTARQAAVVAERIQENQDAP